MLASTVLANKPCKGNILQETVASDHRSPTNSMQSREATALGVANGAGSYCVTEVIMAFGCATKLVR